MGSGSEEFALLKEKEQSEWQTKYGDKVTEVIVWMDELLSKGSSAAMSEIGSFMSDSERFIPYKSVDEIAIWHEIVRVYEMEKRAGIENTIMSSIHSVAEGISLVNSYKWLLYRIDFGTEEEIWTEAGCGQRMIDFINEKSLSVYAINILTDDFGMRKPIIYYRLWQLIQAAGMNALAAGVLSLIWNKWPGNLDVSIALGGMYMDISEEKAMEYLATVPAFFWEYDGEEAREILKLQNELWIFKYESSCSGNDLMKLIRDALGIQGGRALLTKEQIGELIEGLGLSGRISL